MSKYGIADFENINATVMRNLDRIEWTFDKFQIVQERKKNGLIAEVNSSAGVNSIVY